MSHSKDERLSVHKHTLVPVGAARKKNPDQFLGQVCQDSESRAEEPSDGL